METTPTSLLLDWVIELKVPIAASKAAGQPVLELVAIRPV